MAGAGLPAARSRIRSSCSGRPFQNRDSCTSGISSRRLLHRGRRGRSRSAREEPSLNVCRQSIRLASKRIGEAIKGGASPDGPEVADLKAASIAAGERIATLDAELADVEAEVEDALLRHPDVAEAAVIGVPDARWGEVGRAVVVPRAGTSPTAEELLAHLGCLLARYKIPRSVVLAPELPRNATGKLLKGPIRDHYGSDPAP